jgi:hypothetical protein
VTKTPPHLFEMDGVHHCSICKMAFPMHTQHSVHKAFEEHVRKAHRSGQMSEGLNQTTGGGHQNRDKQSGGQQGGQPGGGQKSGAR